MSTIEKSIEINVPAQTAYNQWTQFEDFPKFLEDFKEVRQLDDTHVHWHAKIAGKDLEWDAEITEQIPDQRIAWRSVSGPTNDGIVTFDRIEDDKTRVTVQMNYEPKGAVENIGDATGVLERRAESNLERFKELLESRGQETGAWRGQVEQGQPQPRP